MFENRNNSYHVDSEQVQTCLRIVKDKFRQVQTSSDKFRQVQTSSDKFRKVNKLIVQHTTCLQNHVKWSQYYDKSGHVYRIVSNHIIIKTSQDMFVELYHSLVTSPNMFLIARLARSDPRNRFSVVKKLFVNLLNFSVFHHVIISSLDMFKNCNNSYHIESEQVQTCLNMFRHV